MSSNTQGLTREIATGAVGVSGTRSQSDEKIELRRVECFLTEGLFKRILKQIFPDQRKQERIPVPPLVGYLGTAFSSKPYELGDISLTGFCLLTDERWIPGTEMPVTLQRTNLPADNDLACFTVQATVVRCSEAGVGFSIVLCEDDSQAAYGNSLRVKWVTMEQLKLFLERIKEQPGAKRAAGTKPANAAGQARAGSSLRAAFKGGR